MKKFGDGLNIEFVRAAKAGRIHEPFSTEDVAKFAEENGWNPSPRYIDVMLANGSSLTHSLTYKKYFLSIGNGQYVLSELAKTSIV